MRIPTGRFHLQLLVNQIYFVTINLLVLEKILIPDRSNIVILAKYSPQFLDKIK